MGYAILKPEIVCTGILLTSLLVLEVELLSHPVSNKPAINNAVVLNFEIVIFVGQALQIAQRAVAFRAGQRRHQVVDDHRLGAAFGLGALARIVDDKGALCTTA